MRININFRDFKKNHYKKKHQILFKSSKCSNYTKVENLYKFLLAEKNSFIFESRKRYYKREIYNYRAKSR